MLHKSVLALKQYTGSSQDMIIMESAHYGCMSQWSLSGPASLNNPPLLSLLQSLNEARVVQWNTGFLMSGGGHGGFTQSQGCLPWAP